MTRFSCKLVAPLVAVAFAGSAFAAPITIDNASFEDDVLADGGFIGSVSEWNDVFAPSPAAGTFNPVGVGGVPDGENIAFLNQFGFLVQSLGTGLTTGDVVEVTFSLLSRDSNAILGVGLRTPANASINGGSETFIPATLEVFDIYTATLTVDTDEAAPILVFDNLGSGQLQIDLVSAEIVPEPGSLALMAIGGLMIARRRRA